jgi:hypothetical protein
VVEILEYMAIELLGIVDCYLLWYSKVAYYVLLEEPFESRYDYVD